jgi:uncharacterized protein (TIGR01777 family)
MRIVVAGGTGFLGAALVQALHAERHETIVLTRRSGALPSGQASWTPDGGVGPWASVLEHADAIVNLSGAPLDQGRWTEARKQALVDSRVLPTRSLARAIVAAPAAPRVFLSASGIGYYGPHGDDVITESTGPGADFLAQLVVKWETAAKVAASDRTRVLMLRSGVALAPDGGALKRMLLPFRLGLGGPFGSGRQYLSWIHRRDWIDMVRWLLFTAALPSGPVNVTAPAPVTNAEFAITLARVLGRPHVFRTPAVALRLALGEMADAALLAGQRALPAKAQAHGFRFTWPALEPALRDLLRND